MTFVTVDTIIIRGEINQDMYINVIAQARGIVGDSVNVEIDSPGGNEPISDNIATYILSLGKKVTTIQTGIVASAAVKIMLTGSRRIGNVNFPTLIHNTHVDPQKINVPLDADKTQRLADILDESRNSLAAYYAEKTGNSVNAMLGVMDADKPMTAQQAMELGFYTEVSNEIPILAKIEMNKLQEILKKIEASFIPSQPQPTAAPVTASFNVGDPAPVGAKEGENDMGEYIVVVKDGKIAEVKPKQPAAPVATLAQVQALETSVTALAEAVSKMSEQLIAKYDEQKKALDAEMFEIKNQIKGTHVPQKKRENQNQQTNAKTLSVPELIELRKTDIQAYKSEYAKKYGVEPEL